MERASAPRRVGGVVVNFRANGSCASLVSVAVVLAVMLPSAAASDQVSWTEDFDGYPLGPLSPPWQGSIGTAFAEISETIVRGSSGRSVYLFDPSTTLGAVAERNLQPSDAVDVSVWTYALQTTGLFTVVLSSPQEWGAVRAGMGPSGFFIHGMCTGAGWTTSSVPYSAGRWYEIRVVASALTDTYDMSVDGTLVAADVPLCVPSTSFNFVRFVSAGSWTGQFYLDDVAVSQTGVDTSIIADGGFESGYIARGPLFGPIPPSFGFWTSRGTIPQPVSPPLPVHSGERSLQIDTRFQTYGAIVVQDFEIDALSYEWTFWVFPSEGFNAAEIIYNWDRGLHGAGNIGTRLDYGTTGLLFRAWDTTASFPPIPPGAWHEVRVVANRCALTQEYNLDHVLVGTVRATSTGPVGPTTVIFGDTGNIAKHGLFYYDDVSLQTFECGLPESPQGLVALRGDQRVRLFWSPPTDDGGSPVTNYRIYRGTSPGGEVLLTEVGDVRTFTDTGLTNGQQYCYQVSAVTAAGEGPRSNEACAVPAVFCPRSVGFWKNAGTWPVSRFTLGVQEYGEDELRALLQVPPEGDASMILSHQLIAAKLNVANGSDPIPVELEILQADSMLGAYDGLLPYDVKPSSTEGQKMIALSDYLEKYNSGKLTSCKE